MTCECGCGQETEVAKKTQRRSGHVRGVPMRFVKGHNGRKRIAAGGFVVEDRGHDTPCHVWQGTINADGYGRVAHDLAHRRAYEETFGPIPEGHEVDHLCFVRPCVNPQHLEAVTHAENVRRSRRWEEARAA